MRRNAILGALLLALAAWGVTSLGQSEVKDFPVGTTNMVYELRTEDVSTPETITLTVTGTNDGRYQVKMALEASGTADELQVFGFLFGMTHTTTGGTSVAFDPLSALIEHRDRLTAGQEYTLEGGATFTNTELATIATLPCLQGTYLNPKQPDVRMTVAFSLLRPVFIAPYIREEDLRDGEWVETFSLRLTDYTITPPQG